VTPRQLRGRIVLMVEYYPEKVIDGLDEDIVSETDEWPDREARAVGGDATERNTTDAVLAYPKIANSLASLGFYARSMKPPKAWWRQVFSNPPYPPNIILNINEPKHSPLPHAFPILQQHATYYLRRVYPDGLRVTSSNLDPWVQWRSGTHMACLNWQSWNEAMWLNEAMFGGTGGWVVRPNSEIEGGDEGRKWNFMGRVVGLSALPQPEGDQHDFVGYCHAELLHRDGKRIWRSDPARAHRDAAPEPEARANDMDVVHLTWDQTFEWTFAADALAFLQIKVVRRHAVRRDEDVAVFCARLDQLASGWCLVRLLDMRGKYIGATLLCEFTLQ
jgi:phosphatidylinositol phospholipase C delta